MRGRMMVDGVDAFMRWGVFVEQGGYKSLVQWPSFKKLDSTEWAELDGEEVDLTAPKLDTRSVTLQFCFIDKQRVEDFFAMLADGAYHGFVFVEISNRTFYLRMTSNGSFSSRIKMGKLSLSFSEDKPPRAFSLSDTGQSGVTQRGYELDGTDLSQFGCWVLEGTDDEIRKMPAVRANLSVSARDEDGVQYDGQEVAFKAKDMQLKLLLHTDTVMDFWSRWSGLFYVLTQPEHRTFRFVETDTLMECYYKSCSVSKFDVLRNGHTWCEFTVTLTCTDCRPQGNWGLLSAEGDDWIVTEDSQESRIIIHKSMN